MNFYIFDICFLILFVIGVVFLLVKNKRHTQRDGIIFMYRTQFGVKLMEKIDKKYHKIIGVLRYVIISIGFILMLAMISLLIQSLWVYISNPTITDQIKAPPIAPLIPYFPELFGMKSYFPPFYFTYFLIAIIVVSIFHEFAHGVLMKYSKTKIKSTGFMFLGPILGFFVEQDDKDFRKKERVNQMATLGAGAFSNVMVFLTFFVIITGYVALIFTPSGYSFDTYTISIIDTSQMDNILVEGDYGIIQIEESNYFIPKESIEFLNESSLIYAYEDTPAFRHQIKGVIKYIDDYGVHNQESLALYLSSYKPGENAIVTTYFEGEYENYNITFASSPLNSSKAYLGVASYAKGKSGMSGVLSKVMLTINPDEYDSIINKDVAMFIYYLFWWIMIINLLVGLFNMLPWGMLDGGRFLELAIGKFTKEETSKKTVKVIGRGIFLILLGMTLIWLFRIIT